MIIIPIRRATIRRENPRPPYVPPMVYTISGPAPVPPELTARGLRLIELEQGYGEARFVGVPSRALIDYLLTNREMAQKWALTITGTRHSPNLDTASFYPARYTCDYLPTLLRCGECGRKVRVEAIEQADEINSDGNEYAIDVCPHCKASDSFPDYEYERISDVVPN